MTTEKTTISVETTTPEELNTTEEATTEEPGTIIYVVSLLHQDLK